MIIELSILNKLHSSSLPKVLSLMLIVICVTLLYGCGDDVLLSNTSGNENGILLDGEDSSGQLNDKAYTSSNTKIDVGSVSPSATSNEVIAFTNLRPVAITTPAAWTTGNDDIPVPFSNEINIPVTVWIVRGPFATQQVRAINASTPTTGI